MQHYGLREVEKLLHLPRSTIRALVEAGFVCPGRGPRNAWLFSFQDLVVLRTAQSLSAAKVPARRITTAVKELRRHLPPTTPLSGLSMCAVGDRVVVKERGSRWQAESGQYLLELDVEAQVSAADVIERGMAPPRVTADEWFARATALEGTDDAAAIEAYERAIDAGPDLLDARINLGRLLHANGRLAEAERVYRAAIDAHVHDALLLYNLGVLLEDRDRAFDAAEAYKSALELDPTLIDCHYNLALLYDALSRPRDAIRHMSQYRRMTDKPR
jgi:Tetratricopeptide repeat/MerR HTH family regulatory protein